MLQSNQMFKNWKKSALKIFIIFLFLLPLNLILYKIFSQRASAFGCFDDCFNYIGGYFLLNGKTLYSQIWFNHQPLMAIFSSVVQVITHPINIYDLLLKHREFIMIIGFFMDALIIYRFGLSGVGFALFYEFSKFYIFGDRFLGEALIPYFAVYVLGVIFDKFSKQKILKIDYVLSAIFAWLIIFLREPYALLGIFLYFLVLFDNKNQKIKALSVVIFSFLTIALILTFSFKEYILEVVTENKIFFFSKPAEINTILPDIFRIFFYPIYIYFGGVWNLFRILILGLDSSFIVLLILYFISSKNFKLILILGLILGLSNLRPVVLSGQIFYSSFHLLPWYAMLIFASFWLLKKVWEKYKKISVIILSFIFILFGYLIFSPNSYIHDKINQQEELITNYGNILQVGEVVRHLSKPNQTLFLDGADDLIYWQAKLLSPYQYSWYTSIMPRFSTYTQTRDTMFKKNPPDFYYAFCIKGKPLSSPPKSAVDLYQPLYSFGKPTCLYIKKSLIPGISADQWSAARDFKYELAK